MATLAVLKFGSPDGAEKGLALVEELQKRDLITVDDAAVVTWRSGARRPRTRHLEQLAGTSDGALGGACWGMVLGIVFFVPFLGLAIGSAAGALAGHLAAYGITPPISLMRFAARSRRALRPSSC